MVFVSSEGAVVYLKNIPWYQVPHSSKRFALLFSVVASHNEPNVEEDPAEITLDAIWRSGINLKKTRPKIGLRCSAECRTWLMTVAWLRVVLKNITSPHHHINPSSSSCLANWMVLNPLNLTFAKKYVRLWGARESKGFLLSCIPLLPPFIHS